MTNTILLALAPIFFVMALGYGAGRLRTSTTISSMASMRLS
jgi:hypothetical protein